MIIDKGLPDGVENWPAGVLETLKAWELGDVVASPPFFYFVDPAVPVWAATANYTTDSEGPELVEVNEDIKPPFGLVTTQTCDLAEEGRSHPLRPFVQIAPIFPADKGWVKKLRQGRTWPRFLMHVPDLTDGTDTVWAADLRIELPVEKGWLASQPRLIGFADEADKRSVGRQIAELRGRPAFATSLDRSLVNNLEMTLDHELDEGGRLADCSGHMLEVGIQVDSFLDPRLALLTVLTDGDPRPELEAWFDEWSEAVRSVLEDEGINLQAVDCRSVDEVSAREYQRLTPIWP